MRAALLWGPAVRTNISSLTSRDLNLTGSTTSLTNLSASVISVGSWIILILLPSFSCIFFMLSAAGPIAFDTMFFGTAK